MGDIGKKRLFCNAYQAVTHITYSYSLIALKPVDELILLTFWQQDIHSCCRHLGNKKIAYGI